MRIVSHIVLFAAVFCMAVGDEKNYQQVGTIEGNWDHVDTDNIGFLYLTKGDELRRFTSDGTLQFMYSDKSLGAITSVDATNSLRIIVFYQDLAQLCMLDNTLSLQGEPISLDELGFDQVTEVCASNNNHLWLFDRTAFRLIRVNHLMEYQYSTTHLNQLLGLDVNPNFMLEQNNWLYVNDPNHGIFVFDNYGTYSKTIPIKGLAEFQVGEDVIYYIKDQQLHYYHLRLLREEKIETPRQNFSDLKIHSKRLFIQYQDKVEIWSR